MSTFRHGLTVTEITKKAEEALKSKNGVVVAIGDAPIHLAADYREGPQIIANMNEFKERLGYVEEFDKYYLCEVAKTFFELYKVAPVVFINTLDLNTHAKSVDNKEFTIEKDSITLSTEVILNTLVVKKIAEGQPLTKGVDYLLVPGEGSNKIVVLTGGEIPEGTTTLTLSYKEVNLESRKESDLIGSYDENTGKRTGLEALQDVFTATGKHPSVILTQGFATENVVAALKGKVSNISGLFKAQYYADIDQEKAPVYSKVEDEKKNIGANDEFSIPCYASVKYNGKVYSLSTHAAALKALVDLNNNNLPYEGASNKKLIADAIVIKGEERYMDIPHANVLNSIGVSTIIRFGEDFLFWGNRTGIYPNAIDPKDTFIAVRSMFNFISNSLILDYWKKVDNPLNRRLIDSFVDDYNIVLNSYSSAGAILGGRVEFRNEDNPTSRLADGKIKFYIAFASPTPAEEIEAELEYDLNYLSQVIGS